MTRLQFVAKATRIVEKRLEIPPGWWGTWRVVRGPKGIVVRGADHKWTIRRLGVKISVHGSRSYAIAKARALATTTRGGGQ